MNFYSHFFVASPQRYKRVTSPGVQLGILKARGGYPNLLFFLSGFFFHEHWQFTGLQDSREGGELGISLLLGRTDDQALPPVYEHWDIYLQFIIWDVYLVFFDGGLFLDEVSLSQRN